MNSSLRLFYGFGLATATVVAAQEQIHIPAFTLGAASANQPLSLTGTRGWIFSRSVGPDTIAITRLGVFDSGGDGLVNSHEIGLWRSDGVLLTSAMVPAGADAPLVDGYRYVSISPVLLSIGAITVIGAHYQVPPARDVRPTRFSNQTLSLPSSQSLPFSYSCAQAPFICCCGIANKSATNRMACATSFEYNTGSGFFEFTKPQPRRLCLSNVEHQFRLAGQLS